MKLRRARSIAAYFCVVVSWLPALVARPEDATFKLPPAMLGTWVGTPEVTPVGPFQAEDGYRVAISRAANGDYLIENNIM